MELLNALLAFSVAMLVFSTMSMVVVEILYRASHTREKYFNKMIDTLFQELVKPRLPATTEKMAVLRNDFVETMISVSGLRSLDLQQNAGAIDKLVGRPRNREASDDDEPKPLGWWARLKRQLGFLEALQIWKLLIHQPKTTERLTAVEFAQRFARTKAGKAMMTHGDDGAEAVVRDLAAQLNTISSGASSDFKQRSIKLALIAALLLAGFLNIDALFLFKQFSSDQAMAERVIKYGEQQQEVLQARVASYEEQLLALEQAEEPTEPVQALLETTRDELASMQQSIEPLKALGMPFGHEYFPYCSVRDVSPVAETGETLNSPLHKDARCVDAAASVQERLWSVTGGLWLLGVFLSVVLIAQGSPFWFQMFQKLSVVLQMAKSMGLGKTGDKPSTKQSAEAEDASPDKAVKVFMQTMAAEKLEKKGAAPATP